MAIISTPHAGTPRLTNRRRPSPLPATRWAIGHARRWSRRRGHQLRCTMVIVALATLLGMQSCLVWHVMAGDRIRLAQTSGPTTTTQPATSTTHTSRSRPPAVTRNRGDTSASTPGATTSAGPPTTVSGSLLAVAIIIAMTGVALGATRVLLLRLKRRPPVQPDPRAASDAVVEQAEADTEMLPAGAQAPEQPDDREDCEDAATLESLTDPKQGNGIGLGDPGSHPGWRRPETGEETQHTQPGVPTPRSQPVRPPHEPEVTSSRGACTATAETPRVHTAGRRQPVASGSVILYDRRLGQRVSFESQARLQWDGHDVPCMTEDLAMRGARLRFPGEPASIPPPAMGTSVQVTMMLDGTLAVLRARVGWRRCDGPAPTLGLQFLGVQHHHEQLLQAIVLRGTPV